MSKAILWGLLGALALLPAQTAVCAAPPAGRERIRMDAGWRFQREDRNGEGRVAVTQWLWREDPRRTEAEAEKALSELPPDAPWDRAAPGQDTFHGRRGFAWYRALLPPVPGPNPVLHFES